MQNTCSLNDEYFALYPEDYDTYVDDMAKMLYYDEVLDYPEDWSLGKPAEVSYANT